MFNSIQIPPVLVLGCNTPHGICVLNEWIEEQTGHAPDFVDTSWSNGFTNTWQGFGVGIARFDYEQGNGNSYGDCTFNEFDQR